MAIGYNAGSVLSATFAPTDYVNWTIGQNLTIGDQKGAALAINAQIWNVGGVVTVGGTGVGSLTIQSSPTVHAVMNVGGNLEVHGTSNGDDEQRARQ